MKVKLCDAFDLQMGKTPSRNDLSLWNGTHKWVSISDIGNSGKYISETKECISDDGIAKSGIKIVPKGTVIMSFKLSIGKVSITAEDMYTNEAIMAFIDKKKYPINTTYLYYLLSGTDWSEGSNKAVMGLTLNKATLSQKTISIPSLEEQRYAANVLDRISDLIALRKQQLDKLDELVKARFVEMFGDPKMNPMGWPIVNITTVMEGKVSNGFFAKRDEYVDDGNVAVLGVAYVVNRMYSQCTRPCLENKSCTKRKIYVNFAYGNDTI